MIAGTWRSSRHEIVALLSALRMPPLGAGRPAQLVHDVGEKFADPHHRRSGLFRLNLQRRMLDPIVGEPCVDDAVDDEHENDETDQRRRELHRQRGAPCTRRRTRATARLRPGRRVERGQEIPQRSLDHLVGAGEQVTGGSSPIALAVFRLMTKRYLVGCSNGMSPGRAPLKMRSIIEAARVRDLRSSAP